MGVIIAVLLTIAFLIFGNKAQGQENKKGAFAQFGVSVVSGNTIYDNTGANIGIGFGLSDYFAIGGSIDFYTFNKDKPKWSQVAADFRVYFPGLSKKATGFVSVKQGLVIYSKSTSTVKTNGGYAFDLLIGFRGKLLDNFGLTGSVGYSRFSFKSNTTTQFYDALKVIFGISI